MVHVLAFISQALTPLQSVDIATTPAKSPLIGVVDDLTGAANRVLSALAGKLLKAVTKDHPHPSITVDNDDDCGNGTMQTTRLASWT
jgi:hypothetical protein